MIRSTSLASCSRVVPGGHYWRQGIPQRGIDFTERTACVDFSAINTGRLVAYRWSGEREIREEHYVNVGA